MHAPSHLLLQLPRALRCSPGILLLAVLSAITSPIASAIAVTQPVSIGALVTSPYQQVTEKSFSVTPETLITRANTNLLSLHCTFHFIAERNSLSSTTSSDTHSHIKLINDVSPTTGKVTLLKLMVAGDGTEQSGVDNLSAVVAAYGALVDGGDGIKIVSPTIKQLLNAKTSPAVVVLNNIRFIRVWQGGTNLFAAAPL
ncbi:MULTISPECIES: hypothetical protein [Dickeya]|uniref:hypothetical protein n=1 Tax=Dickeya TaxID=204037 RepID=UPI001CE60147|nr:hypothetical protein FGI04_09125 [Dickeya zeae]